MRVARCFNAGIQNGEETRRVATAELTAGTSNIATDVAVLMDVIPALKCRATLILPLRGCFENDGLGAAALRAKAYAACSLSAALEGCCPSTGSPTA